MKKSLTFVLAALLCIALLGGCSESSSKPSSGNSGKPDSSNSTQIPSPFTSYDTVEEAQKALGVDFKQPAQLPEGFSQNAISVMHSDDGSFAQIVYANADGKELTYRVSNTYKPSDLNGDYTVYETTGTLPVGELSVSCQGDGETFSVLTWEKDGCSYCIMSQQPLTAEQAEVLVAGI